ncbi:Ubiquitin carboxyl-terminal hydrolase 24 [Auxenochlorella protothecoides]|uniref:Ubiquitin carboxyl-terminal hydrolase n=1 Tax=Auxenochlorella protothecoides TaxID=3075 RepID=A0A087SL38_AUXPR|nr:Ubiquitin carboxyl-terminal hydrolase 24 [Auxenochlorella protothecoides]KFM26442.1 Ubiquitin carboxyl-terminal hydrolase 24 [Auxenochlorella protothecoides]
MERPRNLEQRKVLSPSLHPGPRLVLQEALTIQPHSLVPAAILLWCSKGLPNRGPSSLLPLDAGPLFASSDWVASAATRYEPRGLLNPGNLCFASATVQALLASPAFCSLLSGLAREGAESLPRSVYPTLAALAELAGELQPLGGAPFVPGMLADIVAVFAPLNCTGGDQRREQQDAQEFLTFLVDSMHAELSALAETRGWSRCEAQPGGSARGEDDGEEWLTRSGKRNVRRGESGVMGGASPATALFQGRIASFVAASGAPASVTLQPFCALGLHILRPGIQSVVDALEDLTAAETVAGYRPFPGSQPVSATKTLRLQTLPYLLTLHLMRFEFGGSAGDGANKVGKRVSFEPYITIKGQWLTSDSGDHGALYKLIATVSHRGAESSSGHYTADVLHPSGRWLRFDDGDVLGVSSQQVFTDRPYLLLYQRLTEEDKAAVARRR